MFLPHKTLSLMYKALARSHFDYCDIIYHIPSKQTQLGVTLNALMEKSERIQYQTALAVTGAWQGSCRSKLYEELGWGSLSGRRWCRRILQIHKIVNDKTLSYLKNKLPRLRRPLYRQSSSNTFHEFKCKSLRYISSFFPDAITSCNNGITQFGDIPSFNVLTSLISLLIYVFVIRVFIFVTFCATVRATLAINVIAILQKYHLTHLGNKSHLYLYGHHAINFPDIEKSSCQQ